MQPTSTIVSDLSHNISEEARNLIKREGTHCQLKKLALIFTVFFALVVITLLRGNGATSVITRCSVLDWVSQLIFLLICLIAVGLAAKILTNENRIRN